MILLTKEKLKERTGLSFSPEAQVKIDKILKAQLQEVANWLMERKHAETCGTVVIYIETEDWQTLLKEAGL